MIVLDIGGCVLAEPVNRCAQHGLVEVTYTR